MYGILMETKILQVVLVTGGSRGIGEMIATVGWRKYIVKNTAN